MRVRVLLVEDDASNRVTLTALLEDERFGVDEADSLAEARGLIAAGKTWDCVLLDLQLGDGRGTELVPCLRASAPGARIVLMSGAAPDRAPPGIDVVVAKPASFDRVLAALRHPSATR